MMKRALLAPFRCSFRLAFHSASEGLANTSTGSEEKDEVKGSSTGDGGVKGGEGGELPWAYTSDDSISFPVDCVLQGDLLVR